MRWRPEIEEELRGLLLRYPSGQHPNSDLWPEGPLLLLSRIVGTNAQVRAGGMHIAPLHARH